MIRRAETGITPSFTDGVEGVVRAEWALRRPGGRTLQEEINALFRSLLRGGSIAPGSLLPTTRSLAAMLECSRNTCRIAYDQLIADGYLVSSARRATYAAARFPEDELVAKAGLSETASAASDITLSIFGRELETLPGHKATGLRTFWPHETDAREFPFGLWSRLFASHWREARDDVVRGHDPAGYLPLREAIVSLVRHHRGIICHPSQVIICNGGASAITLLMTLLVDPHDRVWLEEATPGNAPTAIHMAGGKTVLVPVDDEGLSVEQGRELAPDARLALITPNTAYPAGRIMSLRRRKALLAWAEQSGAMIIEDDHGSEFLFEGQTVPAISALDRGGRSFYIGTFSNYLFPSLRLNYIIAPAGLAERIVAVRYKLEFHPPMGIQPVVASFLSQGHLARHAKRMHGIYSRRRDALRNAFERHLPRALSLEVPDAGLNAIARAQRQLCEADETALIEDALSRGVGLTLLRPGYHSPRPDTKFLVGFGAADETEIEQGALRLAGVFSGPRFL